MTAIPSTYDGIFELHRGDIPLSYLRALAWSESSLNPNATVKGSSAKGLFQILKATQDGYEHAHGYPGFDRTNPSDATMIAVAHLSGIIAAYNQHGLKTDWEDRDFVSLLTLGYKAGWSNVQGVAFLLGKTARKDWTLDGIIAAAQVNFPNSTIWAKKDPSLKNAHGGYMSDPVLRRAVARTVDNYFEDLRVRDDSVAPIPLASAEPAPATRAEPKYEPRRKGRGGGFFVGGVLLAALGIAVASKRKAKRGT